MKRLKKHHVRRNLPFRVRVRNALWMLRAGSPVLRGRRPRRGVGYRADRPPWNGPVHRRVVWLARQVVWELRDSWPALAMPLICNPEEEQEVPLTPLSETNPWSRSSTK